MAETQNPLSRLHPESSPSRTSVIKNQAKSAQGSTVQCHIVGSTGISVLCRSEFEVALLLGFGDVREKEPFASCFSLRGSYSW